MPAADPPGLIQFVETTVFTRRLRDLGLDDHLREIQDELLRRPSSGVLDPGTGGLRKVRISARGKGKSGGARIHYLYLVGPAVIYLVFVYGKDERDTLSQPQKKQLKAVVEQIKKEWRSRR